MMSREQVFSVVRMQVIFAWYDMWIGAFWDRQKRRLYIFPIPMVGLVIQFSAKSSGGK